MTGAAGTTVPVEPYRSTAPNSRAGFGSLLRSEWTKFVTVRGWLIGLLIAALVTIGVGVISAMGSHSVCAGPNGQPCAAHIPPTGPDGTAVTDRFTFVHRTLDGDGSLTVRLTSLTGADGPAEPWAKAGIIIKQSTTQGSPYTAIMVTGDHGVRLQDNYSGDVAGPVRNVSAGSPQWLRLDRSGDTITGSTSTDGAHWEQVGSTMLDALPRSVPIGMFVTSPDHVETTQRFGGIDSTGDSTDATAVFDSVTADGTSGDWQAGQVGGDTGGPGPGPADGSTEAGGVFTVTGSGNIAPAVAGPEGNTVERSLVGVFAGLIVMIVIGTLFVTSEYRRGLIRSTLSAEPRRVRVLAAKAVVVGGITFVVGLAASAIAFVLVNSIARGNGKYLLPVSGLTQLRVIVGTAALLAFSAVLALAVGTLLRRAAGTVATVTVLVVLPYILAVASVLPSGAAQWLLRVTPAAGFAIQQSTQQYDQVDASYVPATGYFPLPPVAGLAVLAGWTVLALGLASVALRRRDVA